MVKFRYIAAVVMALTATFQTTAQNPYHRQALLDCRPELSLDSIAGIRPRVKGESPQGMAVHDGVLFALYHGGSCAAVDITSGVILGDFMIDGAAGTHCNNASFGIERANPDSKFPLLYVSECYAPCRCFVEEVTTEGSRLVATIIYTGSGIDSFCDWCIDCENRYLYAYGRTPEKGVVLKRFALPSLADADESDIIQLDDKDVLNEFVYPAGHFGIAQGSHIHNGLLYLPTGVPQKGHCCINVVSLEDGTVIYTHDIDDIALEPEGLCVVGDRLWQLFAGGNGTIYSFGLDFE